MGFTSSVILQGITLQEVYNATVVAALSHPCLRYADLDHWVTETDVFSWPALHVALIIPVGDLACSGRSSWRDTSTAVDGSTCSNCRLVSNHICQLRYNIVLSRAAKHSTMTNLITCECLHSPCSLQAPPFQQEQQHSSMTVLARSLTAANSKAAPVLFDQLDKALQGEEGKELVVKTKVCACCSS